MRFLLATILVLPVAIHAQSGIGNTGTTTQTVCALLASPSQFSGRSVRISAKMTSTKEGTDLWDGECPHLGIVLWVQRQLQEQEDFRNLTSLLAAHGLSSRPVVATFEGIYLHNWRDSSGAVRRDVLMASRVENAHQSADIERR